MTDTAVQPDTDTVLTERRGGVLVLTLNPPDRLNAWNAVLERRYFTLLTRPRPIRGYGWSW